MIRTLHCSKNLKNYNLCLDNHVAGFTHRGPSKGDLVYLLFKKGNVTYCGARFTLNEVTDEKPWEEPDKYVLCYTVKDIEYCNPFEVSELKSVGGEYWPLKYLQGAKDIQDAGAVELLNKLFDENKTDNKVDPISDDFTSLLDDGENDEAEDVVEDDDEEENENSYSEKELAEIANQVPDLKISIMGTFQTVNFINESDQFKGLEMLVAENFFDLFTQFNYDNSILISKNRLFKTQRRKDKLPGVSNIPDGVLLTFDKDRESPIHIYIIEYECFGMGKTSIGQKTTYMNKHIIPQLMQFASSFSVITDQQTRDNTVDKWIESIVDETSSDELIEKVDSWMRALFPRIRERQIVDKFKCELTDAFKKSVQILLVIDELSDIQKETIKNIINSFKLESSNEVMFDAKVVKLVQKIKMTNENNEYGLTVQ